MNIAILGWGEQGRSSFEYWNRDDNEITVCDRDESVSLLDGFKSSLGETYLHDLDKFDLIIRTPALHPRDIAKANNPEILEKVWSNTNEFMKVCPTRNIIGVTGTKGKGTTSTLIAKILEASGYKVHLGGNIGIPPLELLKNDIKPDDWVVLELANFQLIDLKTSPHIAVCLMVVPEHMDWHEDIEEYIAAKQQQFINQSEEDIAIYYPDNENSLSVASASEGKLIPYYETPGAIVENNTVKIDGNEICRTSELKLLGKHNWQNVCAAVTAVWQVTQNTESIHAALTKFTGLDHRLEFVREFDGAKYYDDSFGTAPETAVVALEAFSEPKVVILGGSDKGSDYTKLIQIVNSSNVRSVITIGEMGDKISDLLRKSGYLNIVKGGSSMKEIVETAKDNAKSGDVILLSTACASFDMFKNYKDRGEKFKQAVAELV